MINNTHNLKKGFSLAEVLIATIVRSMIMGSVLAFVQYSGEIWRRGNDKISAQNYNRMAFELIKQDLLEATSVSTPTVGASSNITVDWGDGTIEEIVNNYGETTLVHTYSENNRYNICQNS